MVQIWRGDLLDVSSPCPYLEFDVGEIVTLLKPWHTSFFPVRLLHLFALDEPCTYCFAEKPPCPGELEQKPVAMSHKAEHTAIMVA